MFKRARLIHKPSPSLSSVRKVPVRFCAATAALFCFLSITSSLCCAQEHDVLCSEGSGGFEAETHTGVTGQVRAARKGGVAARGCGGILAWKKHRVTNGTGAFPLFI